MGRLRFFYALASLVWLTYYTYSFAAIPVAERNPHFVRSYVFCLLAIVVVPVSLGFIVVFKAAPWFARRFDRARQGQ